jgi:hypothetical protein
VPLAANGSMASKADYRGVADWWGVTWMILAEARGVLTPEKRAAAWCRHGERTWWS